MNLDGVDTFYFAGIGGIGMSALARYFHRQGHHVMGYDRVSSPLTHALELEGIAISYSDKPVDLPALLRSTPQERIAVIYTPALPAQSSLLRWFKDQGFELHKRSAVLGAITRQNPSIAIAGTHGKTTTATITAHILHDSGHRCNAFLGGVAANYGSNLIVGYAHDWSVVEADEYDRSFLQLYPDLAVITSVDADHLDIYETAGALKSAFNEFSAQCAASGTLLVCDRSSAEIQRKHLTYGFTSQASYRCSEGYTHHGQLVFDLNTPNGELLALPLKLPGRHNIENTTAAVAIALLRGVSEDAIRAALRTFKGIYRRFEYHLNGDSTVFIDDYAHHPRELAAAIEAARTMHPGKNLLGIFQPHLFSRTRDFGDEFAESLALLDEVWLLDIYPAREEPISGIDSQWLLDKIPSSAKKRVNKSHLLDELKQRQNQVVMTLGAGDIDRLVQPVKEALSDALNA